MSAHAGASKWDDAASLADTLAHRPELGERKDSNPPPHTAAYPPRPNTASSTWGYGGAGMHEEHHDDASPRLQSRPHPDRNDSLASWSKLLRGAGYDVPEGDTGELDEAEDVDNGPLSTIRRTLKRLRVGTIAWICIVFALLWIPGLVALLIYDARPRNNFKRPAVWKIGIFWWSVWMSAGVWLSYWAANALSRFTLRVVRPVFGGIPSFKIPIAYLFAVRRYIAFFLWALCIWISWLAVMVMHFDDPHQEAVAESGSLDPLLRNGTSATSSQPSLSQVDGGSDSLASLIVTIGRALFGVVLCSAILLGEKLIIQSIAYSFHRVSYETRIAESKFHVKVLVALYSNARTDLGRTDVSLAAETHDADAAAATTVDAKGRRLRNPLRFASGVRRVTKSSASVLGNMARDMAASSGDAAPFSPRAIVLAALGSAHETRRLARRIFWSYASIDPTTNRRMMGLKDIAHCFPDKRTARAAMESLDKDSNATIDEEECEAACLEMRRERIGLMSSMHDIDSAVAKLDHIFMSLYAVISAVIIAALLSVKFGSLVTSLGSMVLGLSWLLSGTAQEALGAILFVFVKHPYDIGDHVIIPSLLESAHGTDATFVVHEIQLLSSVFKTTTGKFVQMGNAALAQRVIVNLRRSGPIEEELRLDVEYTTSLQQIETLRTRMLAWVETQGRDFLPGLDIEVQSLADQTKMTLVCGIRFKSNWQNSNLRVRRRNRWVCTLKLLLEELKIYGPNGDPHAMKGIQRVAMVDAPAPSADTRQIPHDATAYQLMDDATYNEHNVYGEGLHEVLGSSEPSRAPSPGAESTYGRNRRAQYAAPTEQQRGGARTTDIELGARRA